MSYISTACVKVRLTVSHEECSEVPFWVAGNKGNKSFHAVSVGVALLCCYQIASTPTSNPETALHCQMTILLIMNTILQGLSMPAARTQSRHAAASVGCEGAMSYQAMLQARGGEAGVGVQAGSRELYVAAAGEEQYMHSKQMESRVAGSKCARVGTLA